MQRCIKDIRGEISRTTARSAWERGVRGYAEELFVNYIACMNINDDSLHVGKIQETDLLRGAKDWAQYSYGGCAEVCDVKIRERLCSKTENHKMKNGERPPNSDEDWLDVQARALSQAARIVIQIVNRRDELC